MDLYPAFSADVRFKYGGASTNCVVRLSGTSPRIACVGDALVAAAQETLPAGCRLKIEGAAGKGQTLFLCNPSLGLMILFQ